MKWKKFTLETTTDAVDYLGSMFDDIGIEGMEIEDNVPLTESETKGMFIDILPELPPDPVPDGPLQLFHAGKVGKDGGHGHMHGFGHFPGRNRIQAPFFRHKIGGFLDLFPCESYFWRHGTFFLPVFDPFDFIITDSQKKSRIGKNLLYLLLW